jgi:hypothetical protein
LQKEKKTPVAGVDDNPPHFLSAIQPGTKSMLKDSAVCRSNPTALASTVTANMNKDKETGFQARHRNLHFPVSRDTITPS